MCVCAVAFWNVGPDKCVCSLCAHMHSLFAALGATKYLKCRHGTVISEQGLKVGHNSAGPGQDLSQEQKDWGGGHGERTRGCFYGAKTKGDS